MEKPQIIQVLEDAELAHEAGDFSNALKFYEHFFDHALDDDPYALYGVRLSYCLNGWARLAQVFPGAEQRLKHKKQASLDTYLEERNPERFHDYLSICRVLGIEDQALEEFLKLHSTEPKSAAKLSKYVWDDLVNAEYWSACSALLPEPAQKLDELFALFDESAQLKDIDSSFDDIKFEQHIVDTLLSGLQNVVMVLRYADRTEDIEQLQRQFQQALSERDHPILAKQAHAKSSFLFGGH